MYILYIGAFNIVLRYDIHLYNSGTTHRRDFRVDVSNFPYRLDVSQDVYSVFGNATLQIFSEIRHYYIIL